LKRDRRAGGINRENRRAGGLFNRENRGAGGLFNRERLFNREIRRSGDEGIGEIGGGLA
jgi:hypothetical protein